MNRKINPGTFTPWNNTQQIKRRKHCYTQQYEWISRELHWRKKPISNTTQFHLYNYAEGTNNRSGEQIHSYHETGQRVGVEGKYQLEWDGCGYKREIWENMIVMQLFQGLPVIEETWSVHMKKLYITQYTHINASETGGISIISVDGIMLICLAVVIFYHSVRWYHFTILQW